MTRAKSIVSVILTFVMVLSMCVVATPSRAYADSDIPSISVEEVGATGSGSSGYAVPSRITFRGENLSNGVVGWRGIKLFDASGAWVRPVDGTSWWGIDILNIVEWASGQSQYASVYASCGDDTAKFIRACIEVDGRTSLDISESYWTMPDSVSKRLMQVIDAHMAGGDITSSCISQNGPMYTADIYESGSWFVFGGVYNAWGGSNSQMMYGYTVPCLLDFDTVAVAPKDLFGEIHYVGSEDGHVQWEDIAWSVEGEPAAPSYEVPFSFDVTPGAGFTLEFDFRNFPHGSTVHLNPQMWVNDYPINVMRDRYVTLQDDLVGKMIFTFDAYDSDWLQVPERYMKEDSVTISGKLSISIPMGYPYGDIDTELRVDAESVGEDIVVIYHSSIRPKAYAPSISLGCGDVGQGTYSSIDSSGSEFSILCIPSIDGSPTYVRMREFYDLTSHDTDYSVWPGSGLEYLPYLPPGMYLIEEKALPNGYVSAHGGSLIPVVVDWDDENERAIFAIGANEVAEYYGDFSSEIFWESSDVHDFKDAVASYCRANDMEFNSNWYKLLGSTVVDENDQYWLLYEPLTEVEPSEPTNPLRFYKGVGIVDENPYPIVGDVQGLYEYDPVPLEGAGFILVNMADGTYAHFDNEGKLSFVADKSDATEVFSDEDGLVDFGDIPFGTYILEETTVPDGYEFDYLTHEPRLIPVVIRSVFDWNTLSVTSSTCIGSIYVQWAETGGISNYRDTFDNEIIDIDEWIASELGVDKESDMERYLEGDVFYVGETVLSAVPWAINYEKLQEAPWGFIVHKSDSLNHSDSLAGAVFGLYTDESCLTTPVSICETDIDGEFTVSRLAVNETYYLKELDPPDGHKLSDEIYAVSYDGDHIFFKGQEFAGYQPGEPLPVITIYNDPIQTIEMPFTGQQGIIVLTVLGVGVVVVSLFFGLRRRKDDDE